MTLLRLTPAQIRDFDASGSARLTDQPTADPKALLSQLETHVDFRAPCGKPNEEFVVARLSQGPLYIRFDRFQPDVLGRVRKALTFADARGVVLDLRFNGGGYPMLLLNALLPRAQLVYRVRNASGLHDIRTDIWTRRYSGPLAVLTGPASASAAEIAAAVLKAAKRAVVVGRATNGSVMGTGFYPLPDGGQVQLPVEEIVMLDGKGLEGAGVSPDFEVYPTLEQVRAGEDAALQRAVQTLRAGTPR